MMRYLTILIFLFQFLGICSVAGAADLVINGQNGTTYQDQTYDKLIITNSSNISIKNCNFSSSSGRVVDISDSTNIRITNCDIDGLVNACTGIATDANSSYIYITGCKIHDIADDGAELGGHHLYLNGNSIYRLYAVGTDGTQGTGPCYNGHSDGIELINVSDSEFIGNLIYDVRSTSAFYMLGASWHCSNLTIRNNVFYTPESGFVIYIQNVDNIDVYNNIFWQGIWGGAAIGANVTGFNFYNNITHSVNYSHFGISQNSPGHNVDYNLIGATNYSGYTPNNNDIVNPDPKFANIPAIGGTAKRNVVIADFELQSTSPAINKGVTDSNTSSTDYYGNSRDSIIDIGAIEYNSSQSAVQTVANLRVIDNTDTETPPEEEPDPSPSPSPDPDPDTTGETTSISQYGITWTFSGTVQYGQFANGDYYVLDPGNGVRITNISPGASASGSRALNGSMLNPRANGASQGYDGGSTYFPYDASLNVGLGVSSSNPLVISAGDTLISSISENPYPGGNVSYLKTASVLTCLGSVPPAGSFRPGYCDRSQKLYNKANLNYSLLGRLNRPSSTPALANVERAFQRVWLDHMPGWTARFLHANDNMSNYGRELSNDVSIGALMLNLDFSNTEKEKLMISFVQLGIDLYSIVNSGARTNWANDGGHASGRKWPILFAGLVLNDNGMKSIAQKSGDYINNNQSDYIHFGEDDQTFYVNQTDVNLTNSASWNPDTRGGTAMRYTNALIGMPEWAIRHSTNPVVSDAAWYAYYRQCCNSFVWTGFVLSAHIMDAKSLWNHNALFDYQDRYMAIARGANDPFGFTVSGQSAGWREWHGTSVSNYNTSFQSDMWDLYRSNY